MINRDMAEQPKHRRTAGGRASLCMRPLALRYAAVTGVTLFLGGCTSFGNSAFSDPSKYELYNCQQLTTARTASNNRVIELEGLMAKAETGAAGSVVSGLAYQTDYVATKADRDAIDAKLASNNCSTVAPAAPAAAPPVPSKRKR